jgi:hypothetical protein
VPEKLGQAYPENLRGRSPGLSKMPGAMRIISFIGDEEIIKAILGHLGLWLIRARPPAQAHAPPLHRYATDALGQTIPDTAAYGDPDYPWDAYITP